MPKRIVDGEGVWQSDKLARVQPESFRAEYANLIPLALANGSFECNARRVWSSVYGYNRPSMTAEIVGKVLDEFERVGLLFRWKDSAGREWGYWTGIEKSGRLPSASRISSEHYKVGAMPPADELRRFIGEAPKNGQHAEPEPEKEPVKRFVPPEVSEVAAYMTEKGLRNPQETSERFMAFYQSNGWKVGRNSMKSWKDAVITWKHKQAEGSSGNSHTMTAIERKREIIQQGRTKFLQGEDEHEAGRV